MRLHYDVSGGEFLRAGEASSSLKKVLKQLGVSSDVIRKIAIAMYEAEINMVIHANGGVVDVDIDSEAVRIKLEDTGPGIPDIALAMTEGYSTASDEVRDLGFGAGMGLPNMKKNADFLNVMSEVGKGTTVEIKVNL
ncbi:MAG: ATP-binding protein [Clostridiales bacterium]|jgi:anti-sigma regulatory factor (Ser/Thr protein kinase)|nr:ATP-binding protein [Clostridiales bacterium]